MGRASRDHLAIDLHLELAEAPGAPLHGEVELVFDLSGETRRARTEASGRAVHDHDFHAPAIGRPGHVA